MAARDAEAVVMIQDKDFVELLRRLGPPPKVLWLTCVNTSNARLREVPTNVLPAAMKLLDQGEILIEIGDVPLIGSTWKVGGRIGTAGIRRPSDDSKTGNAPPLITPGLLGKSAMS